MRSLHMKQWLACAMLPALAAMAPAWAAKAAPAAKQQPSQAAKEQFVDGIAAVVNKRVITLGQVEAETKLALAQLRQRKIEAPDIQTLRKQVLQRMITDELIRQEADKRGIKVNDAQLQQAVESIAQRNKIPMARLRQEIEKSGVSWDDYLKNLRHEISVDMLRQRAVDSTIRISDSDIDAYLKNPPPQEGLPQPQGQQPAGQAGAQQAAPRVLGLAQILVAVPEGAPADKVQELRRKAEAILARLKGGADFASTAAASSDGPQALKGGELGVRPADGWPDLFLKATQNLKAGQITGILQSGNGFHILKVLTRGQEPAAASAPMDITSTNAPTQPQGPMMVTQTHVRHILIKVDKAMSDERAHERLVQLRQRLEMGEKFDDLAKRYSEDASAPQGGDLGWVNPGETVLPFEQAMNALQPGQISEPVKTQFGWHLIQVEDRRTKDMETEFKRMQARQALFQRRVEPAFEDWLSQLHGQAYIDNRLDPQTSQKPR
ncbi:peptidylprolyl isomerase [Eoetvoesiella caeni]